MSYREPAPDPPPFDIEEWINPMGKHFDRIDRGMDRLGKAMILVAAVLFFPIWIWFYLLGLKR